MLLFQDEQETPSDSQRLWSTLESTLTVASLSFEASEAFRDLNLTENVRSYRTVTEKFRRIRKRNFMIRNDVKSVAVPQALVNTSTGSAIATGSSAAAHGWQSRVRRTPASQCRVYNERPCRIDVQQIEFRSFQTQENCPY